MLFKKTGADYFNENFSYNFPMSILLIHKRKQIFSSSEHMKLL